MMTDIFSIFDPSNSYLFSFFSMIFFLFSISPIIISSLSFWMSSSPIQWTLMSLKSSMFNQSSRTMGSHLKSFTFIIPSIFILIILMNLMGLLPYMFSLSSHLIFTLSIGFPLWMSLIISGSKSNPSMSLANLLPSGAPDWLSPPLIIIETLSIIIRPITLCFRLAANMTAGHIVLALIATYLSSSILLSSSSIILLSFIQVGYFIFEIGICLIQAYIFSLLITLYSDDHPL
uniref:ATP synthase F0 subunit 6 n=1 Tax=Diopatra cuprea TaxID=398472 RepID=UPI001D0F68F5|nr:ATP synthase F0 subunit 6 [Diopatra cuprea]QZM06626.1 ATP synthase F0 subunit 6 [Diopatra cuprea]